MQSQPGEPLDPVTTAELADLQAGLLDDDTATRLRRRVRADPDAARRLAALDRVRRELADLGSDPASAPPVPAEVSTAVENSLRAQHRVLPTGATTTRHADRPLPARRMAAVVGVLAATLAVGIGAFASGHDVEPAEQPSFRTDGPTAEQITVHRPPSTMPLPAPAILGLLDEPADLGALTDPRGCLTSLDYPPDTPILGARPVPGGVLLVLPGDAATDLSAVLVATRCSATSPAALARTGLARPSHAGREHPGLP